MGEIIGKTALVTGSTSGIGLGEEVRQRWCQRCAERFR